MGFPEKVTRVEILQEKGLSGQVYGVMLPGSPTCPWHAMEQTYS